MVSTAVIDHVLRKISAADFRDDAGKVSSVRGALKSLKPQVKSLQEIADLGVWSRATRQQMEWRNRVVSLACGIENFFDRYTCPLDHLLRRDRVKFTKYTEKLFKELTEEIAEIEEYSSLRHKSCGSTADGYNPCLPMPALQHEFLGMEGAKDKLARLLLDGEKQLKTVSIVGFAGLGKTALALEIYRETKAAFECHARVTLSRNPRMKQLLQHLLSQVRQEPNTPQDSETSLEPEQLISEITHHLQYKRYLILLDDMWESASMEIKRALPNNSCGSRIIMTTRKKCLAHGAMYEMERLGLAESENLVSREIYGSMDGCMSSNAHAIARDYDGIPLAMVSLARLEKEQMNNPNIDVQVKVHEVEQAKERILLSYTDLKPSLKAHMMLLCMFPFKYQIERNLIIRIWRAEGLGYARSGSSQESRAEDILDEFIDCNAILPVNQEDISQLEAWKVHWAMFEAILLHSAEEDFLLTLTSSKIQLITGNKVRRLALHSYNPHLERRLRHLNLSFISSLSIFWDANRVSLDKFINLRVLDIHGWKHLKDNDLKYICKMYLLRYLSLRNTSVSIIPKTIKNLLHLETLDLRETRVTELPSQVGQLPKLLDLLVGSDHGPSSNARVKIQMGFQYFKALRTLGTIHLSHAWILLDSLQHLTEVTIMCPSEESSYSQGKLCQTLKQRRELKSLTLYGGLSCSMEFLHSLDDDPPRELHKLRVTGSLLKIPQWIGTREHLVLLQIKVCRPLQPNDMEKLGEIQSLQHLLLGLDYLLEHDLMITAGFPALKRFSVDCRVPWLNFQSGAMPNLTELKLKFREGVANQDSFPSGIHHLLDLKRIAMYYSSWCQSSLSVKATVEAMVKAVREHPGPVKLVINGSTDVNGINGDQAMLSEHAAVDDNSHAGTSSSMQ